MKPILKWEIDSIQAVIDEEKENRQGTFYKKKKPREYYKGGNVPPREKSVFNMQHAQVHLIGFLYMIIDLFELVTSASRVGFLSIALRVASGDEMPGGL